MNFIKDLCEAAGVAALMFSPFIVYFMEMPRWHGFITFSDSGNQATTTGLRGGWLYLM